MIRPAAGSYKLFTTEAQRAQRVFLFCFPLRGRKTKPCTPCGQKVLGYRKRFVINSRFAWMHTLMGTKNEKPPSSVLSVPLW